MVIFDEDGPWAASVTFPDGWRLASPDEIAEAERIRAYNHTRPIAEWLIPNGVDHQDGVQDGLPVVTVLEHGMGDDDRTLCGIPGASRFIYRHPFYGTRTDACPGCATKLGEMAADPNRNGQAHPEA